MIKLLSEEEIVLVETIQELEGLGFLDKSRGMMAPTLNQITQTQHEIDSQRLFSQT